MQPDQQEFYASLVIWGTVILLGTLFTLVLGALLIRLLMVNKKKNIIKELYGKERKNGQKGSHGHF